MHRDASRVYFSYAPADDLPVVGGSSRFGFVSMIRLNLIQSLARRGAAVAVHTPGDVETGQASGAKDSQSQSFASLLRSFRQSAGLSQEALAERARISVNGLSLLERSAQRTPRVDTLALLVEALGLEGADRVTFENAAFRNRTAPAPASPPDDPFDPALADVLGIVLTPAWLESDSCRGQLERFTSAVAPYAARRVLIVRREPVEPGPAIEALERRLQFDFFRDASREHSMQTYYRNDGRPVAAFYDVVDALTEAVYRQAVRRDDDASARDDAARPAIFVAPPADDMELPYRKLVAELQSSGYRVLPAPALTAGSLDDVDACLASALCSIHLLGDADIVDDAGRSRVSFPLSRAAARARADATFRRIVFAPRYLFDDSDRAPAERDPIEVHERYATAIARDSICGDTITDFIIEAKELIRAAERDAPASGERKTLAAGQTVFVNFHPGDVGYARDLANALRRRGLRARFAAFEDDKIANKITNAGLARESHAVVHCWATASDAWLYAEAADYEDWRKLGRSEPFHTRAAVAGPPESGSKSFYSPQFPPEAIDVYVDLTKSGAPLPDDLDPIVVDLNVPRPQ